MSVAALSTKTILDLYGAESDRGGWHRGARFAPAALVEHGIVPWLAGRGLEPRWRETVASAPDAEDAAAAVASLCRQLAAGIEKSVRARRSFAVFGGDHSCAIGTWSGARDGLGENGPLGLVWFDAHMDSHTPETTPSGRVHGMPLACLMGYGAKALTEIAKHRPPLSPRHVCLVGVRSFEAGEKALLDRLGVRVIHMDEVRTKGVAAATTEALAIARRGTAGFGVSVDLDVLDPEEAPGVGSRVDGGMRGRDLAAALRPLCGMSDFLGLEVAEYNPVFDHHGTTARQVRRLVAAAFLEGDRA